MPDSETSRSRIPIKGSAASLVAAALVVLLLVSFPAYRWFFLISVGIGVAVAGILFFWHRLRPIREEDVDHKRPLGLQ
jgi:hypothetical protein